MSTELSCLYVNHLASFFTSTQKHFTFGIVVIQQLWALLVCCGALSRNNLQDLRFREQGGCTQFVVYQQLPLMSSYSRMGLQCTHPNKIPHPAHSWQLQVSNGELKSSAEQQQCSITGHSIDLLPYVRVSEKMLWLLNKGWQIWATAGGGVS